MAEREPKNPDQENDPEREAAEKKLRTLAGDFWFNYYLSQIGRGDDIETEKAHEAYERYLDSLDNSDILPREMITKILNEARAEAEQDAGAFKEEVKKKKISGLN